MEDKIREKALELGYEDCAIVRVGALAGYREKLEERIARIPMERGSTGPSGVTRTPRRPIPP